MIKYQQNHYFLRIYNSIVKLRNYHYLILYHSHFLLMLTKNNLRRILNNFLMFIKHIYQNHNNIIINIHKNLILSKLKTKQYMPKMKFNKTKQT